MILYVILVGDFPFKGRDLNSLYKNIRTQKLNLNIPELNNVSATCKNLISQLLCKEHENRLSSDEALQHDWFKGEIEEGSQNLDDLKSKVIMSNLSKYKNENQLNKAIKLFNFKLSSNNSDILRLRDLFLESDNNNNAALDRNEFRTCISKLNDQLGEDEIDDMFDLLDVNKDGNIN